MSRNKLIINTIIFILSVFALVTYLLWSLLLNKNYTVDSEFNNHLELDINEQISLDELIMILQRRN